MNDKNSTKIQEVMSMLKALRQINQTTSFYPKELSKICQKEFTNILQSKKKFEKMIKDRHSKKNLANIKIRKRIRKLFDFLRQQIRYYDNKIIEKKKCIKCNEKANLHLHHNSYNIDRKIIVLCEKCHRKIHNKHNRYND